MIKDVLFSAFWDQDVSISQTGEAEKAEARLTESLKMAQDLKSLVLLAEAYSALASHYELSGQPIKALKSFKQYLKAKGIIPEQ